MGQRDLSFLLVPVLALFAFLLPMAGGKRADDAPVQKTADGAASPTPVETTKRTAADLLSAYSGTGSAIKAEQCLIATLPDPVDAANLSYTYDRYLDALQRAMEAADYVLDRFDMPWLDKETAAAAARAIDPRFRLEPGRLLFRKTKTGTGIVPPTALVFVVGETPTAGIHKAAFTQAVTEYTASCAEISGPIPVLGPSFSGSESSLHALLAADPGRSFKIVTGSATAVQADALTAGTKATFQATLAADVDARNHFLMSVEERERSRVFRRLQNFLNLRRLSAAGERTTVALLVEANTSYGREAVSASQAQKTTCPLPPGAPLVECVPETIDLIRLPFPMHIASLRGAARENSLQNPAARTELAPGRQSLTELNLRDAPAARTVLPLASRTETASIEIVLATLLQTLEQEHVRYIGLVATDVQDRIFLSQQIRHHLPNSVLFMFSTDLLYLHPDANVDLRGAHVVTSYPLFSANQEWTAAAGPTARLLFPTHTTQGVYNAALALLGLEASMQEYGYPLDSSKAPPLWLSIVGTDGLWPVALLGEVNMGHMVDAPKRPRGARTLLTQTHPWMPAILLLVCLVPAVFAIANLAPPFRERASRTSLSRGPIAKLFSDTIFPGHRFGRRMYLMACFAALCCAYLLTVTLFLLPAITHFANPLLDWRAAHLSWIFELLLVVGLVVVMGTLVLLARLVWLERDLPDGCRTLTRRLALLAIGGGSMVLVVITAIVCWRWIGFAIRAPAQAVFVYLRSADLASSISPLLPLMLICGAALAWATSSLRRLRMLEGPDQYPYGANCGVQQANSFLGFDGPSFEGILKLEQDVLNAVGRRSMDLPWPMLAAVLGFLVLAWARLFGPRSVPTAEGTAFDALFALGFLTVYTALALSFVRFVSIWRRLLRLLQRLAWHPTVKAYARLRDKIPGKPKINLTSGSQIFTALEFSVDRAGELIALARILDDSGKAERKFTVALRAAAPAFEAHVQDAERALHAALEAEARGDWREMVVRRTQAEQCLSHIARAVTSLLRPAWRLPATDAPERVKDAKDKDKPNELDWFKLGEDFLTSRVAAFLSHVVPQLQNLIIFVTAGLLLMLLAVTSYPFQPRQLLLLFNTTVILAVVSATLVVFVQMERETILSVMSDSEPGAISWNRDFVSRVVIYVIFPIVSLLGAQFPEAAQHLFRWTSSFFGTH